MKKILSLLLLLLVLFSCSSDGDGGMDPDPDVREPAQASFSFEISSTDPNVLILNNTTNSTTPYTSVWDFGKGEGPVVDSPGLDEVRYDESGTYTITLTVISEGVNSVESKNIIVDEFGICPDGICSPVGSSEGLKSATSSFLVGMITRASYINGGGQHTETLIKEFNSLTSEYEMKMNVMYPSQDNYDFSAADVIVNFAQNNSMNVHGHALIWHNATPDWVTNFAGSDAEFEAMVEGYITTTVTRYKGKVASWDVVNEAIDDGGGNPLRNSIFRQRMGDDFVKKCFQFARNADPDALLFYNDYNVAASSGKRAAIFSLVDSLGDLIDGVGAQMHISINGPSASDIQAVVDGTVSRGLKIHFSELDIRTNPEEDGSVSSLSNDKANQQKAKYKEVVEIYNAVPLDNKYALTVWGLRDNESWLLDFWGVPDWPLLFDSNYNRKQAYDGFLEGLN